MEEIIYFNGALVPRREATIPVMDYGFLFGYGLFETMRAYGGMVFRLNSHLDRLVKSAEVLGIAVEVPTLKRAVEDTIRANGLREARVRVTVSIGEGSLVPDPRTCTKPTVLVIAGGYVPYAEEVYQKGFRVIVSSIHRNSQSPVPGMKTANYLESLLSRKEARNAGVDDALLLNERGLLAEASTSNVFLVSKRILKTPRTENGILPGITRGVILELASQLNIKAVEVDVTLEELLAADEVFLTNSLMEVMPVTAMSGKVVGPGRPGAITRKLMTAYKDLVLKETANESTP